MKPPNGTRRLLLGLLLAGVAIAYLAGLLGLFYVGNQLGCCTTRCCRHSLELDRAALRSVAILFRAENDGRCPTTQALVDQHYIAPGPWQDDYTFHCDANDVGVQGPPKGPSPPTQRETWCPTVRGLLALWLSPLRLFVPT